MGLARLVVSFLELLEAEARALAAGLLDLKIASILAWVAGFLLLAGFSLTVAALYVFARRGVSAPGTAGDFRTSNFLPWQANGNECAAYFCAPFWPEFRKIDFLRAIRTAQTRTSCQ